MLFSLGHGQHVVQQSAITTTESAASRSAAVRADTEPLAAVAPGLVAKAAERSRALETANGGADAIGAGDAAMVSAEAPEPEFGKFRYLFPYGGSLPERPDMPACLDALADSMVEANATAAAAELAEIPPVFTYFGQFIDHDLTANTDRDSADLVHRRRDHPGCRATRSRRSSSTCAPARSGSTASMATTRARARSRPSSRT